METPESKNKTVGDARGARAVLARLVESPSPGTKHVSKGGFEMTPAPAVTPLQPQEKPLVSFPAEPS